jgi:hypothetical protein
MKEGVMEEGVWGGGQAGGDDIGVEFLSGVERGVSSAGS